MNEWYLDIGTVDNPLAVLPFTLSDDVVGVLAPDDAAVARCAFATLGLRYRRRESIRRSIRWLLLPVVLVPVGVATELLLGTDGLGGVVIWLPGMAVMLSSACR